MERQQATLSDMRTEVLNVASTDPLVFSERIDIQHMKHIGQEVQVHIVGVYELGPDGKIVSEREYGDMKEVEAQMGEFDHGKARRGWGFLDLASLTAQLQG
jgi:limonene-1,2-epoxide hydrolase